MTIGENFQFKNGELVGKDDSAAERNRKYHDLTQNDYDFILISQPAWNDLDLDPVTKGSTTRTISGCSAATAMGNAGDKRTNKIKERYEQRWRSANSRPHRRDLLQRPRRRHADRRRDARLQEPVRGARRFGQQPKFLGGQGLSNRALDMPEDPLGARAERWPERLRPDGDADQEQPARNLLDAVAHRAGGIRAHRSATARSSSTASASSNRTRTS
jgi:hypothetical protein